MKKGEKGHQQERIKRAVCIMRVVTAFFPDAMEMNEGDSVTFKFESNQKNLWAPQQSLLIKCEQLGNSVMNVKITQGSEFSTLIYYGAIHRASLEKKVTFAKSPARSPHKK